MSLYDMNRHLGRKGLRWTLSAYFLKDGLATSGHKRWDGLGISTNAIYIYIFLCLFFYIINLLYLSKHYLKALPHRFICFDRPKHSARHIAGTRCTFVSRNEGGDGSTSSGKAGILPSYLCSLSASPHLPPSRHPLHVYWTRVSGWGRKWRLHVLTR